MRSGSGSGSSSNNNSTGNGKIFLASELATLDWNLSGTVESVDAKVERFDSRTVSLIDTLYLFIGSSCHSPHCRKIDVDNCMTYYLVSFDATNIRFTMAKLNVTDGFAAVKLIDYRSNCSKVLPESHPQLAYVGPTQLVARS